MKIQTFWCKKHEVTGPNSNICWVANEAGWCEMVLCEVVLEEEK